jgi:malate dehydrogenase (oxaloacetate-decarboxylating)
VVLAALTNALKLVKKKPEDLKIVMSGAGAAGTAIAQLLKEVGVKDITAFDSHGAITKARAGDGHTSQWMIENSNPRGLSGTLTEGLAGADVFIGVSVPNIVSEEAIASMAKDAIVFALANPDPEIHPALAAKHARVVATGRSDFPNQINNVLAFPGIFRGLLDAGSAKITNETLIAAANAIAQCVDSKQLNESYIVPSVFHPDVAKNVAQAVEQVSKAHG